MTVRGTLAFVLRAQGIPRGQRKARIAELLALVDLEGMDRRRASTLSGGEGQRLALARALAVRTDFLLLDEPLGPLDGDRRRELLERLENLRHELSLTLIHVTHDPQEAAGAERRILQLTRGSPARAPKARPRFCHEDSALESWGLVVLLLAGWLGRALLAPKAASSAPMTFTSSSQCRDCHPHGLRRMASSPGTPSLGSMKTCARSP